MLVTTKAIVLSSIKYAEADLIVHCYSEIGVKSYFIKGLYKSKKGTLHPSMFQVLTQLEITANYKPGRNLHFIREAKIIHAYTRLNTEITRQSLAIFTAEILFHSLKEEEENKPLYNFLETALSYLENGEHLANFHLMFLIQLSKYLGFYPKIFKNQQYFDLTEGIFTNKILSNHYISGIEVKLLEQLIGMDFDADNVVIINKKIRLSLLENLLLYFKIHLTGFQHPKSLEVLKAVYH
ncbi:MAG: DNA repair protein RecO [Flavobacteriales bacterium]|nr:MAG: DNA repair protein RecO [Flavobacteriales bacterium]